MKKYIFKDPENDKFLNQILEVFQKLDIGCKGLFFNDKKKPIIYGFELDDNIKDIFEKEIECVLNPFKFDFKFENNELIFIKI